MNATELQYEILFGPVSGACASFVHTNEMPKIGAAEAMEKDRSIADLLNGSGVYATSMAIPAWQAKKALIKLGKWRGIVLASQNNDHPAVEAAYAAVALAEDARLDADFLDHSAAPLMAALVSAGLMSAQDRTLLESMSRRPSTITAAEVSRALRGPWE